MVEASPWAEVHHSGALVCEARLEEERWLLVEPPQSFLEALPMVVALKELAGEEIYPAQLEQEFGEVYARRLPGELADYDVPEELATPWEV